MFSRRGTKPFLCPAASMSVVMLEQITYHGMIDVVLIVLHTGFFSRLRGGNYSMQSHIEKSGKFWSLRLLLVASETTCKAKKKSFFFLRSIFLMVVWNFQGGYPLGLPPPLNEITGPYYMPKKAILLPCITFVITLESKIFLLITRDIRADERRGGKSLQLNVWVASSCAKDSPIFRTSCIWICTVHDHDTFRLGHVSSFSHSSLMHFWGTTIHCACAYGNEMLSVALSVVIIPSICPHP